MTQDLQAVVPTLVDCGKCILAADETPHTLTRRFDALGIPSTEQTRRAYREMLFATPGAGEYISAASLGTYTDELEHTLFTVGAGAPQRELRDD